MAGNTLATLLIKLGFDTTTLASGAAAAKEEVSSLGTQGSNAVGGLNSSLAKTEGQLKSTGLAGKISSTALGVGIGLVGFQAIQMGEEFITGIFTATREEDKLIAQTNAVIASTHGMAGVTTDFTQTYAHQLQDLTGVNEATIQRGEDLLLTFTQVQNRVGAGNDIFNQATSTVLDMSVALGEDAKSASIQLGKALNDPITGATALRRVGVMLTEQQQDQIKTFMKNNDIMDAQKVILKELGTEFGGSAKAFGDSADGMSAKLGNSIQDFQKLLGGILLPIINVIISAVTFLLQHIADLAPVLAAIAIVVGVMLLPTIAELAVSLLMAAIAAAPLVIVILAVSAAVAALIWAFNSFPIVRQIVEGVFNAITGVVKGFVGILLTVAGTIIGVIAAIPSPMQQGAKDMQKTLDDMRTSVDAWGTSTTQTATDAGHAVGTGIDTGVADGVDASTPTVVAATKTMVQIFGSTLSSVKIASRMSGADSMSELASGIKSKQDAPVSALKTLHDMLSTELTKTVELHRLKGELASKDLKEGLHSGDPAVRAQAIATRDLIIARMDELKHPATVAGSTAGTSLGKAFDDAIKNTVKGSISVAATMNFREYAIGSYFIPEDQIAMVHAGEMILTAAQAAKVRQGLPVGAAAGIPTPTAQGASAPVSMASFGPLVHIEHFHGTEGNVRDLSRAIGAEVRMITNG